MTSKVIEVASSLAIGISALAVAAVIVAKELRAPPTSQGNVAPSAVYLEGWEGYVDNGIRRGPEGAAVKLIEFVDFECPFCRQQASRLDSLLAEFPDDVQLTTHHFPLTSIHRFAQVSAEAVECAAIQDHAVEFATIVFKKQDSLGLKTWSSFAEEAGVPDIDDFEACRTGPHYFPRIARGMGLGERAGVTSTPTLVVNGWMLPRPPSSTNELRELVRTVLRSGPAASGDTISVEPAQWEWVDSVGPAGDREGSGG